MPMGMSSGPLLMLFLSLGYHFHLPHPLQPRLHASPSKKPSEITSPKGEQWPPYSAPMP